MNKQGIHNRHETGIEAHVSEYLAEYILSYCREEHKQAVLSHITS